MASDEIGKGGGCRRVYSRALPGGVYQISESHVARDRRKVQQPPCTMTFGPTGYKRDGVSLPVLDERSTTAPYLWTPMPCPDCLKLAKAMRSTFAMEGVNVTALDAFIKERER